MDILNYIVMIALYTRNKHVDWKNKLCCSRLRKEEQV